MIRDAVKIGCGIAAGACALRSVVKAFQGEFLEAGALLALASASAAVTGYAVERDRKEKKGK